ncbi:MAG: type II toxin-antitoxin system HicA family toxin [Actinomycetaceae bacterium]|nr:type II toxin-antitoxin system HicA family toxin [Actinomycetaceae bacterium]
MDKEVRKLVKELEAAGFTTERTSRGHVKVYRDGTLITTLPGTPSSSRSLKNAMAYLRRAGFRR